MPLKTQLYRHTCRANEMVCSWQQPRWGRNPQSSTSCFLVGCRCIVESVGLGFDPADSSGDAVNPDGMYIVQVSCKLSVLP